MQVLQSRRWPSRIEESTLNSTRTNSFERSDARSCPIAQVSTRPRADKNQRVYAVVHPVMCDHCTCYSFSWRRHNPSCRRPSDSFRNLARISPPSQSDASSARVIKCRECSLRHVYHALLGERANSKTEISYRYATHNLYPLATIDFCPRVCDNAARRWPACKLYHACSS